MARALGWVSLVLALAINSTACSRAGFEAIDIIATDEEPTTWGDFAATLDVPDCPASNPVLVVNTTADELDGGSGITDPSQAGSFLSLPEALWIADNRGVQQTILFDGTVFPVDAPGRIVLTRAQPLPSQVPICLDARRRGVILDHAPGGDGVVCSRGCFPSLDDSSLIVGLTVLNIPYFMYFGGPSQIAGCRLHGNDGIADLSVNSGIRMGPGNVLWGNYWALRTNDPMAADAIEDNYFGYDPVLHTLVDLFGAVVAFDHVRLSNNIFGLVGRTVSVGSPSRGTPCVIENNSFGVDSEGQSLGAGALGLTIWGGCADGLRVGPGNTISGVTSAAISVLGDPPHITRNSITGNAAGLIFSGPATPIAPPGITTATRSRVEGTCPVAGTVEVFSDPGDQGETFLGDVTCDGVTPWSLSVTVPRGRKVTATLTDTQLRTSPFSTAVPAP